jgi:hypothetical protein
MKTKQIVIETNWNKKNQTPENICQKCHSDLTDCSYCRECRQIIQQTCLGCGKKELKELHEFCYCQLEVLVPSTGGFTK